MSVKPSQWESAASQTLSNIIVESEKIATGTYSAFEDEKTYNNSFK